MVSPSGPHEEYAIASAILARFHEWCLERSIRLVVAKAASLDLPLIGAYEQWGFRYVETWIYNRFNLNRVSIHNRPDMALRVADRADKEQLLAYSHGAFDTHRFHADTRIARERAESLYLKWIETAFEDPRQTILVHDHDGKPAAAMIYYSNDYRAQFGLRYVQWKMALVDPAVRGKGIGFNFFVALLYHHRAEEFDVVDSGLTIRNLTSLNLHNRIQFKVISTIVTLHKWIDA
jgi:GNAT superfamily N-acetyltransferase